MGWKGPDGPIGLRGTSVREAAGAWAGDLEVAHLRVGAVRSWGRGRCGGTFWVRFGRL